MRAFKSAEVKIVVWNS